MIALQRELDRIEGLLQRGRLAEAARRSRALVRRYPRDGAVLKQCGDILVRVDGPSAAVPYLRRAVSVAPVDAASHTALADSLAAIGATAEAAEAYSRAVSLAPDDAALLVRMANTLRAQGDFAGAIDLLQRALSLDEALAPASGDLANVLLESGHAEAGLQMLRDLLARNPDFAEGWTNLATTLQRLGRDAEALPACVRALELAPRNVEALLTLANACTALAHYEQARAALDAALAIEPQSLRARYNRSLVDLTLGNFVRGWEDYRLRDVVSPEPRIASGLPLWNGTTSIRSLLVRREQGIGTQIMFARCLPQLVQLVPQVTVECDSRLVTLLGRSYPAIRFAATAELFPQETQAANDLLACDAEILLADLPAVCATQGEVPPPGTVGHLRLDPARIMKWNARLAAIGEKESGDRSQEFGDSRQEIIIGISWRGGGTTLARQRRSAGLEAWRPLCELPGARFVSLQYDAEDRELRTIEQLLGRPLVRWDDFDPRTDLEDLAALAKGLDVVVTVDNSTAHLAAGAGARVWTLLPWAADWRWQTGRDDTPWYPTMTLVRPAAAGGWPEQIARVADCLRAACESLGRSAGEA